MAFSGGCTPVLAKHTKHLSLVDILSFGLERMQRNFEPMRKPVEAWKRTRLRDEIARLVIYRAFAEGELDVPKDLARRPSQSAYQSVDRRILPKGDMESLECVQGGMDQQVVPLRAVSRSSQYAPLLRSILTWPRETGPVGM